MYNLLEHKLDYYYLLVFYNSSNSLNLKTLEIMSYKNNKQKKLHVIATKLNDILVLKCTIIVIISFMKIVTSNILNGE